MPEDKLYNYFLYFLLIVSVVFLIHSFCTLIYNRGRYAQAKYEWVLRVEDSINQLERDKRNREMQDRLVLSLKMLSLPAETIKAENTNA